MRATKFALSVCLLLAACSEPEGPEPLPPIKEKFTWRLDTIRSPGATQFVLNHITGTGDGAVYLVAMGNAGLRGMLWKYVDSSWTAIELNSKYGGPLTGLVSHLSDLDADGDHLVWMTGSRRRDTLIPPITTVVYYGFLASYDGQSFTEIDLRNEPEMTCLEVVSDRNIWFGGHGPYIYHYNGSHVQKYLLPMDQIGGLSVNPLRSIMISEIVYRGDEVFVAGLLSYDEQLGMGMVSLTLKNETGWMIINYSAGAMMSWAGGMTGLWISPEGDVYSGGDHVYKYEQGEWRPLYWTVMEMNQVFGSSNRDIWAVGQMTNVARCVDGEWISNEFFRIPDAHKTTSWLDGWTDGDRVFIIGNPDEDTMDYGVVAHGR